MGCLTVAKNVLVLDVETYSDLDLKKHGAWAYAHHPSTEILMCAYFDPKQHDEVQVAIGEESIRNIPGLFDPGTIKVAHNAPFERYIFKGRFGALTPPEEYIDTAAYGVCYGLPRSLKDMAEALGVDAKDEAGTRLINLFSKPQKRRGVTYRKDMMSDPIDFIRFVDYCKQDVWVTYQILKKLSTQPLMQTEAEKKIYHLSERINDRGVSVDTDFASIAAGLVTEEVSRNKKRFEEMTGVKNANSVQQVKAWLEGQGVSVSKSLDKDAVADLISSGDTPNEVKEALRVKTKLVAGSLARFDTIAKYGQVDSAIHGCFQYHGAHTGRYCLTPDHEVLTPNGWVRFDEWNGGKIANWSPAGGITFEESEAVSFPYSGEMVVTDSKHIQQIATPDHKVPAYDYRDRFKIVCARDLPNTRVSLPTSGLYTAGRAKLSDLQTRLAIATQADGHLNKKGQLIFGFRKARKATRVIQLLNELGIPYLEPRVYSDGTFKVTVPRKDVPQYARKRFKFDLGYYDHEAFINELPFWDGSSPRPGIVQYVTGDKANADFAQTIFHLNGLSAVLTSRINPKEEGAEGFCLAIHKPRSMAKQQRAEYSTIEAYTGSVHCAVTKTGFFLVRRNGRVWVTGNSGKGLNFQNLSSLSYDSDEETMGAMDEVRSGKWLGHDDMKKLIRACLKGPWIVSDFSAIEARVLAWLAGEQWVLDTFEAGKDIYVQTAAMMYGVDYYDAVQYRKQGKTAVLGCGYSGGQGAIAAFSGDTFTREERQSMVDKYRKANPKIKAFWDKALQAFTHGGKIGEYITVEIIGNTRKVILPSGRALFYHDVTFEKRPLTYINREGVEVTSRVMTPVFSKGTKREGTSGGKITENVVQAVARDLLGEALLRLERNGFDVRCHVHDEVLILKQEGDTQDEVTKVMSVTPDWAPGLPLEAGTYECEVYRKE